MAFSITGCQIRCPDCHSRHLWTEYGKDLTYDVISKLLDKYKHTTCVLLLGGEHRIEALNTLFEELSTKRNRYKLAWYSGLESTPMDFNVDILDYVKFGPYVKELGGLDSPTTNQKFLRQGEPYLGRHPMWYDITHVFHKDKNG